MLLEVHENLLPSNVWPVRVVENIGGRLLLRYEGAQNASLDFWLFYLDIRLHEIGWTKQQQQYIYGLPKVIRNQDAADINTEELLSKCFVESQHYEIPNSILVKGDFEEHEFREGLKLEVLHPTIRCTICPATVHKVINQHFFIVTIDDLVEPNSDFHVQLCCHAHSRNIFPVRWCVRNGLRLQPPNGWKKSDLDWKEYLSEIKAETASDKLFNLEVADHDFCRGLKLEAVNPDQPRQICAATITRIGNHLLWIHLDNATTEAVANHIVPVQSYDLFPIGWCQANDYPLKPPRTLTKKRRQSKGFPTMLAMTADEYRSTTFSIMQRGEGSSFCPKIYFNHRCFSGAFLSKGRVAELPVSIGPGPVLLVMKEVLRLVINAGYKSSRVLRELQLEGAANPHMHQQMMKAKYKGKSYKAVVEICSSSEQIEEFCRQTCIKLECCPLLFSSYQIKDVCPENCSQLTKTKYTAQYLGKYKPTRKVGRPPGGQSNLDAASQSKRGRKRKRGRKKKSETVMNDEMADGILDTGSISGSIASSDKMDEEVENILMRMESNDFDNITGGMRSKRKYKRRLPPPPSKIKTRGIKLPSYGQDLYEHKTKKPKPDDDDLLDALRSQLMEKVESNRCSPDPVNNQASPFDLIYGSNSICMFKNESRLLLDTNPLHWTVQQVVDFIKTTDSAMFARILKDQEIDGQALLLLSLPTVQEYLDYKLGPAVKLCHHVERVKTAFFEQYT